jgi:hypothetical protein
MSPTVPKRRSGGGLIVLFLLLAVTGLTATQSQRIADWFRLRGYVPPAEIVSFVAETAMTPDGRHLFYINRPALEDKAVFRQNCPDYEATIVIGCYRQGQRGIHVLRVDDERLEGVEQVTAAHEMLHAAYERLNRKERQQVDAWLNEYAQNGLTDERIKASLKGYEKTEPGEQMNEMHSIFGTEVSTLPEQLERHYTRYFSDRQAVVKLAAAYQDAFTSREQQIAQYDTQLNELSKTIKSNTEKLAARREELERQEGELDRYRQSGNIERYNAGVDQYNRNVGAYNELLEATKVAINEHNRIVEARNAIAAQTIELRQAIDSSELPDRQ